MVLNRLVLSSRLTFKVEGTWRVQTFAGVEKILCGPYSAPQIVMVISHTATRVSPTSIYFC